MASFSQSVCPNYFKRNNGNGACPDGQLKLYYSTSPAILPFVDSVYSDGIKSNVIFASPDASKFNSLGYISYCITGGNMPPASTWQIYFHNSGSVNAFGCLVVEGRVLPIGIKSFTATRSNGIIALNWQTAFELNAKLFEVQKKSGSSFVTIGTVSATNKETGSNYFYTDNANIKGTSEYRLKLVDKDGEATFSEIRSVKTNATAFDFAIFPNPASRNAKISVTDITVPSTIQVIDNSGRLLKTISVKSSTTMVLNDLQTGIYRVRLITNNSGEVITKALTIIQ